MLSAEWVALTNALMAHPDIRTRLDPPWRVKRLEPAQLRRLAMKMGIDRKPIDARLSKVGVARDAGPVAYAPNQPTPVKHEGAFAGVLFFPLAVELFGQRVEREARVSWGYTPAWDHYDRRRRCMVSGASEAISLRFEVEALPDRQVYQLSRDGHVRVRQQQAYWVPLDFLTDGILSAGLNDEIEARIDRAAREEDRELRERAEVAWRRKHVGRGGPPGASRGDSGFAATRRGTGRLALE